MKNKDTTLLREAWIPKAYGEVLEVGIGSGLNLPFYSTAVQHVYGVDPCIELQQMARQRLADSQVKVDFLTQSADEPFPLSDESIDTVVSTWTLCTIPNVLDALTEMRRVLKLGGKVIFLEHGQSPDYRVHGWQNRMTPVWKRIAGGCHLNRKIDDLIKGAGFEISELTTCYLPGPRPMTFTYQGLAARR